MAYTPTNWSCGDTITADKMNKLEQGLAECCGGGSEPLIVNVVDSDPSSAKGASSTPPMRDVASNQWLDKTWQQISDAFPNVIVIDNLNGYKMTVASIFTNGEYAVQVLTDYYTANSTSDYPMLSTL